MGQHASSRGSPTVQPSNPQRTSSVSNTPTKHDHLNYTTTYKTEPYKKIPQPFPEPIPEPFPEPYPDSILKPFNQTTKQCPNHFPNHFQNHFLSQSPNQPLSHDHLHYKFIYIEQPSLLNNYNLYCTTTGKISPLQNTIMYETTISITWSSGLHDHLYFGQFPQHISTQH